jgi:hypothetical protein
LAESLAGLFLGRSVQDAKRRATDIHIEFLRLIIILHILARQHLGVEQGSYLHLLLFLTKKKNVSPTPS